MHRPNPMRIIFPAMALLLLATSLSACARNRSTEIPSELIGSCEAYNPNSKLPECTEYYGSDWTEADAEATCLDLDSSMFKPGQSCAKDVGYLGKCVIDGGTQRVSVVQPRSDDTSACSTNKTGCELFAGGAWVTEGLCGGEGVDPDESFVRAEDAFLPDRYVCSEPVDGEPAGQGEGGKVCAWVSMNGCVEPGRKFADYGSCDVPFSQRGYSPAPANEEQMAKEDPRLEDPEYVAELDWVKSEIEACGCVCCHDSRLTPEGPSNWYVDAPGNFVAGFFDSGLAFSANVKDTTVLGNFQPEDNNGFSRSISGIPSTDQERMRDFFLAEMEYRGVDVEQYRDAIAGPVLELQRQYEVKRCEGDEGVQGDGTIEWEGGRIRRFYILEAGADNPMGPPNLDLPEGTIWRVDVPVMGDPIRTGELVYGQAPEGAEQVFPAEGAPMELVPGEDYYIYAAADVLLPVTRCIFTYEP